MVFPTKSDRKLCVMKITISVLGKFENTLLVYLVFVRELIRPSNARNPSSTGATSARFTIFVSTLSESFKGFSSLLKVLKIVVKIVLKSSLWVHNLNFCFTNTLCPELAEAIRSFFARRILLVIAVFMPQDHMLPPPMLHSI